MLSPWRTGREAAILPGRFSCRTASTALHAFLKFDRQVTFSPAFLPCCGWQTPQLFWTRKDTERGCAFCVQSSFSCLSKFSVIQFSQVIRLKETLCVVQMGIAVPMSTFSIPKNSAHNLVSPIGGKTISNKFSIIILQLPEKRIYT